MRSALGGLWYDSEIQLLDNPSELAVRAALEALRAVDYSLVVFCGHGSHTGRSTIVQIRPGVTLSEDVLKTGARKHTLILDCCRVIERQRLVEAMAKADMQAPILDPSRCRAGFDRCIEECPPALVTMYACSVDETAGETADGGWYSTALVDGAKDWHKRQSHNTSPISRTSSIPRIFSVTDAHDRAAAAVRQTSGQRQNPTCGYPRSDKRFPFAIIA